MYLLCYLKKIQEKHGYFLIKTLFLSSVLCYYIIEHKSNQFESVEILLPKGKPIKGYLFSARLDVENPEKSRLISNILLCFGGFLCPM